MPASTPEVLRFLFDFDHAALHRNADDVTHEESVVAPPGGGNSLNWVVGHILTQRSFALALLGEPPLWSEADGVPYARESRPLAPGDARPWGSLLADLDATQERIRQGLARGTPEWFEARHTPEAQRTRAMQLHFLQFHEAYHVGQAGLLRRILGKPGAI